MKQNTVKFNQENIILKLFKGTDSEFSTFLINFYKICCITRQKYIL